jgi:solute carrier family 8 (sodium/calcium exchanger)
MKLAKEKECKIVGEWRRSIINHLYHCGASSPEGSNDLIIAKWLSLDNHLHNIHKGHGALYPKCGHPKMKKKDDQGRKKKWLEPGEMNIYNFLQEMSQNVCSFSTDSQK